MLTQTVEELKVIKNPNIGPKGGFLDVTVAIDWRIFKPDGTTHGVGSDGRYYKTDRSMNPRKTVEIKKDEFFS